jgi:predicted homoserine dehydrogenase-like protein
MPLYLMLTTLTDEGRKTVKEKPNRIKCDLRKGERLDGIGGYTCYGLIEDCAQNESRPGLPICLAEDITLVRDVSKDEKILMSDIQYDPHRLDFELYAKAVRCSMSKRS